MSPSHAEVSPADTSNMTHARTTDVGSAEATDVTSAEASHVTSTKATHVAATKAAAMSAAATAAGLRTRGNKAAGKQRSCQNRHPSSFHDLSPLEWAGVPPQDLRQTLARLRQGKRRRRDRLEDGNSRPQSLLNSLSIIGLNIGVRRERTDSPT
jgi:hypothetical protein